MNKTEIIKRLKNDEDYYGEFGKQFLSNSDKKMLFQRQVNNKQQYLNQIN